MVRSVLLLAGIATLVTAVLVTGSAFAARGGNGNGGGGHAATIANQPTLALSCDSSPCAVGGSLTVSGANFTPSSGGQQVFLWVGYPNDYCAPTLPGPCHGFYFHPWVNDDGTFSSTITDALLGVGSGQVTATQYNVRPDKWEQVASASYTVP
jgi:hypothetical protein